MARVPKQQPQRWVSAFSVAPVSVLLTGLFMLTGFYFLTNHRLTFIESRLPELSRARDDLATSVQRLSSIESRFAVMEARIEQIGPLMTARLQEEGAKREQVRNEFLVSQQRVGDLLAKMEARSAVLETQQSAMNKTLERIVEELTRINRQ